MTFRKQRTRTASDADAPAADSVQFPAAGRAPSLMRYAPAMVLVAIAVADSQRFADTDLWGHIAFGRLFLKMGPVSHDPFNYSVPGHAWTVHEWLAEVLMAWTYDCFGILGLKLWKLACVSATIIMLADADAETGASPAIQTVVLIAASLALMPMMQFRPQLYSYIFFAALIAMLTRDSYRRTAPLWLAVPMMALWANLHGGFVMGIAALAIYSAAIAIEDVAAGRGLARVLKLSAITAAATASTLLNPYGINAWVNVLHAANNPITRKIMVDWRPLLVVIATANGVHAAIIFFVMVVVIIATLALTVAIAPQGGDYALLAISAVMAAATFKIARNMPFAVIAAAAPLARHLDLAAAKLRRGKLDATADRPARLSTVGQIIIGGAAIVLMAGKGGVLSPRIATALANPGGAVAFMEKYNLHGNILAEFEWGQYLIFHSAPASRVFIDGRVDLVYPPKVINEYLDFFYGGSRGDRVLEEYPHDYVLLPTDCAAYQTMTARHDWTPIYQDPDSVLFARATSPAAHIPGVPVTGISPPSYFP